MGLAAAIALGAAPSGMAADYKIVDDAIPVPLTAVKGDPKRGRQLIASMQESLCLLCHSGPFPEARFQGSVAPTLAAVGARMTEGQIRLRIVDPARMNPASVMPAYYRSEGLERVAPAFRGRTILSAQQVEDIVVYLATDR